MQGARGYACLLSTRCEAAARAMLFTRRVRDAIERVAAAMPPFTMPAASMLHARRSAMMLMLRAMLRATPLRFFAMR